MNKHKKTSKFLSLILRHDPDKVGIELDESGWVAVDQLITAVNQHRHFLDRKLLEEIVRDNDKQRFTFSENGQQIRANQGHSVNIDLQLEPQTPPTILYHGTATKNIEDILKNGIEKRSRQHVHLSTDKETARRVGMRHGKVEILIVRAEAMHQDGFKFYLSKNGVWLTDSVPVKFLDRIQR